MKKSAKLVTYGDILNIKHDNLIIIGEKKTKIDSSLSSIYWVTKMMDKANGLTISKKILPDEKNKLLELLNFDKVEFFDEIIDIVLKDSMLISEKSGNSYFLSLNKKYYNGYISFYTKKYHICFVEEAMKIFNNKINQLKLQRINDNKLYASNLIETGKAKNLCLSVINNSYGATNGCEYDDFGSLDDSLTQILNYYISQGNNSEDNMNIKNILDIIDKFVLKYGPIEDIKYHDNQLLASNYIHDNFIVVDDIDKMPEFVKKLESLKKRG